MKPILIPVGGFLDVGKTTLLLAAAQLPVKRGQRVGLVTNDQAGDLVDTVLAQSRRAPVMEKRLN